MPNYFTRGDYEKLQKKICETEDKLDEVSKQIGEACQQSSETYHDNFPFEEAVRQQGFWSQRLRELINLQRDVEIVHPDPNPTEVIVGSSVTVEDMTTGKLETHTIGSHGVASYSDEPNMASYDSPLGDCLMGAVRGNFRTLTLPTKIRKFLIKDIKGGA